MPVKQDMVYTAPFTTKNVPAIIDRMANEFPAEERRKVMVALYDSVHSLVHQRLVRMPLAEGETTARRIPIQEYLQLNLDMKKELYQVSLDDSVPLIRSFVKRYGRSLWQDVVEKYEAGLIAEDEFLALRAELEDDYVA